MFSIIRKFIIFLILLFFVYLIASLIIKRKLIKKKDEEDEQKELDEENNEDLQEGFTFNTQSGELNSVEVNDGSLIMANVLPKNTN